MIQNGGIAYNFLQWCHSPFRNDRTVSYSPEISKIKSLLSTQALPNSNKKMALKSKLSFLNKKLQENGSSYFVLFL